MNAEEVSVRVARGGDDEAIVPLMRAFNEVEGIAWRAETMGAALRRLLEDPSLGVLLLARDAAGGVVGYGLATFGYDLEFGGADAFITELFVSEAWRSRGIGAKLLDAVIAELRARGAHAVHLLVRPENARARALYEAREFRPVPRIMLTKSWEQTEEPTGY
jgi:ribosomal protein S18 acetylase RimI-like enzyme